MMRLTYHSIMLNCLMSNKINVLQFNQLADHTEFELFLFVCDDYVGVEL